MYDAPTLSRLAPLPDESDYTTAYIDGRLRRGRAAGPYAFAVHYSSDAFETEAPLPTVTPKRTEGFGA
jgi:hypothetical protein